MQIFHTAPNIARILRKLAMTEKTIFYKFYVFNSKCNFPLSSGVFPITVPPFREPTVTA